MCINILRHRKILIHVFSLFPGGTSRPCDVASYWYAFFLCFQEGHQDLATPQDTVTRFFYIFRRGIKFLRRHNVATSWYAPHSKHISSAFPVWAHRVQERILILLPTYRTYFMLPFLHFFNLYTLNKSFLKVYLYHWRTGLLLCFDHLSSVCEYCNCVKMFRLVNYSDTGRKRVLRSLENVKN